MRGSRIFLSASVLSLLLSLPFCWAEGGITLSADEYQTLKTALMQADEQLTESESLISDLQSLLEESERECLNLKDLLKTQESQLQMLTSQLNEASQSLRRLKSEATWNSVRIWLIGLAGIALGGTASYLILGGR